MHLRFMHLVLLKLNLIKKNKTNLAEIDWEVLQQESERVVNRLRLSIFLSFSFSFAVSNRSAWFIFGSNDNSEDLDKSSKISLQFWRIDHDLVSVLWGIINYHCKNGRISFLTKDGSFIVNALRYAGVDPMLCRVKLKGKSSSNVYAISLPKYFDMPTKTVGVDTSVQDLAIKVIHNNDEFLKEAS